MNETITTSQMSLKDYYESGVSRALLREGKYQVVLKDATYVEHPQNPYIRITLQDVISGRDISTNKFDRGFRIMIAHLKKQLNMEDEEVAVQGFLQNLIETHQPFNIWITIYTDAKKHNQTNINFLEPLPETQESTQVIEDEIL